MKITKKLVRQFEAEQKKYGTGVAIHYVIWLIADSLVKDIGLRKVKTTSSK